MADSEYNEAAGELWLVLLPEKWNKHVQYAWRYDACELAPKGRRKPKPSRPHFALQQMLRLTSKNDIS